MYRDNSVIAVYNQVAQSTRAEHLKYVTHEKLGRFEFVDEIPT